MHRIDGPAIAPGGFFTEGDPVVGTPATIVKFDWANSVQEEICGVVEGAGIALSKPNRAQLLAALVVMIGRAVPVGQVVQGYWPTPPPGFLLCNGTLVSRAAYPALWAYVNGAGLAVADATWSATAWTLFSQGDGATTFRLPDLRSEFIRGADFSRGVDAGRTLGSWQDDAFKAHAHEMGSEAGGGSNIATPVDSGGVDETAAGGLTSTVGGTETRPRNAALAFCVRF